MTDYTSQLDTTTSENAALIEVAQEAVKAQQLEPGIYYDGVTHELIDIRHQVHEEQQRRPDRKTGRYTVTDTASFVGYLTKHGLPQTELWANVNAGTVHAVVNAHTGATGTHPGNSVDLTGTPEGTYEIPSPGSAGHEDHTVTLQLATTDDWKHWTERDGKLMPQLVFAEFIEDHLPQFVNPTAADMLELAQTFQATTKVDFASSNRAKSGETQLLYQEHQDASAGRKGDLTIPDTFEVALQPFENGPAYKVEARFRYRIEGGSLTLGYRLTRPKDVRKAAFDDVVQAIHDDTDRTIWAASR